MKGYMAVIGLFILWFAIPVAIAQATASPILILAPTLVYGYWLLFHGGGIRKFDNWIATGK
jgi:hypothetical protein